MFNGRYSDKYSGRHGSSTGPRPGKKWAAAEHATLTHQLRHGSEEEKEKARAELTTLAMIGMKFATGFKRAVRFLSRRAA